MHSERIPYSTGWHVSIPNKQENPGSVKTRAVLLLPGQETTLLLGSHTHFMGSTGGDTRVKEHVGGSD